jgi:hypothetical protein
MSASTASVISLGLGSWGSTSLVLTLGYGSGVAQTTGNAFACGTFDPDTFDTDCPTETPSGGFEYARLGPRRRTQEEIRRERERFGIPQRDAIIIEDVALRQAADFRLDEEQKAQELRAELKLQRIEMRAVHLSALNERREAVIREEISARLLKLQSQQNETILLLLMAASA